MTRTFTSSPAVRRNVPLLIALIGPSGGGKSFSALRLATGIAKAQPGDIYVIDTEADRALQYAERFKFQHVPFGAPFGSLDYLEALRYCVGKGAKTIIVDSMSHEHEGEGGMLASAEAFLDAKCGDDWKKRERMKLGSFIRPKADRQKLISYMVQTPINLILCFRAKEKIKPRPGNQDGPLQLGWLPIGGDEFWYEMTARALLLPGANGVPEWKPSEVGERLACRRPEQFQGILADGKQLSEDMGEAMARWAAGGAAGGSVAAAPGKPRGDKAKAMAAIAAAKTKNEVDAIATNLEKREWSDTDREEVVGAMLLKVRDMPLPVALEREPGSDDE